MPKPPDEIEILLTEYREICAYQRHEDALKWTVLGLTFTGALAVIAWAIQEPLPLSGVAFVVAAALAWVARASLSSCTRRHRYGYVAHTRSSACCPRGW